MATFEQTVRRPLKVAGTNYAADDDLRRQVTG
jgi:hypothetical protein